MLVPSLCCFEKELDNLLIAGFHTVPLLITKSYMEKGGRFTLTGGLLKRAWSRENRESFDIFSENPLDYPQ